MKLSVVIITYNEQKFLPNCLRSVFPIADEIIVCDKNSKDKTVDIAKKFKAKIIKFSGRYFDEWRNLATQNVEGDWILYIDPDERITPELKKEITKICDSNSEFSAYQISRINYWWGKKFRFCGSSPDYVTRLIKREKLEKWQGIIHESPIISGEIGICQNSFIHLTHRDLISVLEKSYQWTKMEAELFYQAGHKPVKVRNLFSVTIKKFNQKYFKQKGYREGVEGFIESMIQAINRFMVYVHLWQLQKAPSLEEKYKEIDSDTIK